MVAPIDQISMALSKIRQRTLKNPRMSSKIQAISQTTRKNALNQPISGIKEMALRTRDTRKN